MTPRQRALAMLPGVLVQLVGLVDAISEVQPNERRELAKEILDAVELFTRAPLSSAEREDLTKKIEAVRAPMKVRADTVSYYLTRIMEESGLLGAGRGRRKP